MFGKKAEAIMIVLLIIGGIIGLLFLINHIVFFANNFVRDCSENLECTENQYCGSDFKCHEIPIRQQTIVEQYYSYNLIGPALILGIALVGSAFILKKRKNRKEEKVQALPNHEQMQKDWQRYYTSQGKQEDHVSEGHH